MSLTEAAVVSDYALALAYTEHFKQLQARLQNKISKVTTDEAVKLHHHINDIDVAIKYGFGSIISKIQHQLTSNKNLSSISHDLEWLFLGPNVKMYNFSEPLKTEDIITTINLSDNCNRINYPESREAELSERYYLILKQALSFDERYTLESLNEFDTLTAYSFGYLKENYSESEEILSPRLITTYYKCSFDVDNHVILKPFNKFLFNQIEFIKLDLNTNKSAELISKLREQGNNLMSNLAFAKAIQVYTQAYELSSTNSAHQVPQILTNRAIAYIGLNCFPEAIVDLNQAVDYDWLFTPAWAQLGYCQLYMGNSLTALKAYLFALKTSVGELIDTPLNHSDHEAYKAMKVKSVLPQFVQRLCLAIALTERRAVQQNEPELEIREVIGEVRRILANLRAAAPTHEERHYFTYWPQLREPNLISRSERANRLRPNILTQDVSQSIFASNGMEAVSVMSTGFEAPIIRPVDPTTTTPAPTTNATTTSATTTPANPDIDATPNNAAGNSANSRSPLGLDPTTDRIREFMNDFGEVLEDRTRPNLVNSRGSSTSDGIPLVGATNNRDQANSPSYNSNSDSRLSSPPGAFDTNSTQSENIVREHTHDNMISEVLRNVLPGIGTVFSQFTGSGTVPTVVINGREVNVNAPRTNVDDHTHSNPGHTHSHTESTSNDNEDVEMPEQEDLD